MLGIVFAGIWTATMFIAGGKSRLLVLLLAVAALSTYTGIRPITWTVLLLVLLLKILPSRHSLIVWLMPLIFIVWANLHAGFIVGLATVAFFAIKYRRKYLVALLGLCILVTFINPYGPRLYVEIARTTLDSSLHFQIAEWAIFYVPLSAAAFVCLWGAGFWLLRRNKFNNWFDIGPIFFAAGMTATRNIPLFVIATIKDLDKFFDEITNQIPQKPEILVKNVKRLFATIIIGWLAYIFVTTFIPWPQVYAPYPIRAVEYLKAHPCAGHIFNDYNYGGFLVWQLPSQPDYIDGRMPSWRNSSGQKYFDIYNKVIDNKATRQSQFATYDIRCVLLSRNGFNNQLLTSLQLSGWHVAVRTAKSELLVEY